jgi:hypothetical protein
LENGVARKGFRKTKQEMFENTVNSNKDIQEGKSCLICLQAPHGMEDYIRDNFPYLLKPNLKNSFRKN